MTTTCTTRKGFYTENPIQIPCQENSFDLVPDEIALHIFSFIMKEEEGAKIPENRHLTSVCKRFYRLLSPYYNLQAAIDAGPFYDATVLKMMEKSQNQTEGILYASQTNREDLLQKIMNKFFSKGSNDTSDLDRYVPSTIDTAIVKIL